MSVSSLLWNPEADTQPPEDWSNLNVNSIRANQINYANAFPNVGESHVYVDSTDGSNLNSGLTADSPVLTLEKALSVALSPNVASASQIVINLAGSSSIDLGLYNCSLPGYSRELNLNNLSNKFSFVKFLGSIASQLDVPAGNATASLDTGKARFTKYTYSGGLVNLADYTATGAVAFTNYAGISSQNYSAVVEGNDAVGHCILPRSNDGMEADDWSIGLIDCPELVCATGSLAIVSKIPVLFELCKLQSQTISYYKWANFTANRITFLGCRARSRMPSWLTNGEWSFLGSTITQDAGSQNSLCDDSVKLNIDNCLIYCKIVAENELNMNYCDINGPGKVEFLAAAGNLDNCQLAVGASDNYPCLQLSGASVRANNVEITSSNLGIATALYLEDSTLSINNCKILRTSGSAVAASAVDMFGSILSIEGSDIDVATTGSITGPCLALENSKLFVRATSSCSRLFEATQDIILADNSQVYIGESSDAVTDSWTSAGAANSIVYCLNSKINLPEVAFNLENNGAPAFKLTGISSLLVKAAAGWNNTGTGSLYQLGGAAAVSDTAFPVAYTESTTGGFNNIFTGAI